MWYVLLVNERETEDASCDTGDLWFVEARPTFTVVRKVSEENVFQTDF